MVSYAKSNEASLGHVYNGLDDRVATLRTPSGSSTSDTRRFVTAPDGRAMGKYGGSATDVKAEYIWLSPQVNDAGVFGGDDGLGGYMPLAMALPTATVGTTQLAWVHPSYPRVYSVTAS